MLPNLIIAGTGRAGTTSLFRYLADHPRVCASSVKEVHFFDQLPLEGVTAQDIKKYESYFCHCSPDITIRMEATPLYLYGGRKIAEAIRSVSPDVKLIFTLREPVGRAFTVFRANRTNKPKTFGSLSFEEFIGIGLDGDQSGWKGMSDDRAITIARYLKQGCYVRFLSDFYSVFPQEQLCVLFFDDLGKDVRSVMRSVTKFLNIDFRFYDSYGFYVENRTRSYRSLLLHRFAYGVNMKLERILNRYPAFRRVIRQIYNKVNEGKDHDDQISELARRRLQKYYEPYNLELYALLNQQVPQARLPEWIVSARDG